MAKLEPTNTSLELTDEDSSTSPSCDLSQLEISNTITDPPISRSGSFSRLNASAPEFVPRSPSPAPRVVKIHHHPAAAAPVIHVFHSPAANPPAVSPQFIAPGPGMGVFEYYGGGGGFGEQESGQAVGEGDSGTGGREGLGEDVVQKITKQVNLLLLIGLFCYYVFDGFGDWILCGDFSFLVFGWWV